MPETWKTAMDAVTSGTTDVLATVTGSAILTALSFGFIFMKKGIGVVKRLIRIGGKS